MTDAAFDAGRAGTLGLGQPGRSPPVWSLLSVVVRHVPEGAPRFLVAGGLSSLLNWLVRFPLSLLMPFQMAVGLAYGVGMVLGFALYRSWVFPGSNLPLSSQIPRFVAVNAAGLVTVMAASSALVTVIGRSGLMPLSVAEGMSHATAIVLGAVINFIGHRAISFARRGRLGMPA